MTNRTLIALTVATTAAWILYSAIASAEVLHNGKVYETTADRIVQHERIRCVYGKARIDRETGAIVTPKVCTKAVEKAGQ